MEGWIKIDRGIISHWIWKDPQKFQWWLDILMTVNFKDNKVIIGYKIFDCKRGECLMSLLNWGKRWNVSKTVVNNFFTMLENDNMIETVNETVTTRLKVCNYDTYQINENASETEIKRNENGTVPQQSTIEERKERKEEIYKAFAKLKITTTENEKLLLLGFSQKQIDDVYDSIKNYSKNDKYKSLYLTSLTWLKKRHPDTKPNDSQEFKLSDYNIPNADMFGYSKEELKKLCLEGKYDKNR